MCKVFDKTHESEEKRKNIPNIIQIAKKYNNVAVRLRNLLSKRRR
jgi:hypothetical protein